MSNEGDTSNRERLRVVTLPNDGRSEMWFEQRGSRVELHCTRILSTSSGSGGTNWTKCSEHGCLGEALPQFDTCFAHSQATERQNYLGRLRDAGRALSLRGTNLSQKLWDEIVVSAAFKDGTPLVPITMAGAEVDAEIRFVDQKFEFDLDLSGASVFRGMSFKRCEFSASFIAHHARFVGPPAFHQCIFHENVDISFVQVHRVSFGLEASTFERAIKADGFNGGGLILSGSRIAGDASFRNSAAHLILNEAVLNGSLDLADSECVGLNGERLSVTSATRLGPFSVQSLHLPGATFSARVLIEVRAENVNLSSAVFDAGGLVILHGAEINLEQVRLGGPLRVSGTPGSEKKAEILAVRNSDAGNMSFSHIDLSRCSFQGAHSLGSIDLDSSVSFSSGPRWARRRRFIADEYAWRHDAGWTHKVGWSLPGVHVAATPTTLTNGMPKPVLLRPLEAAQVASIYRDLRRSLEAKSDMPGAADFYYGEMDMRRWSHGRPLMERLLLWFYWITCGYGLRPGRALFGWLLLVASGAWAFHRFGSEQSAAASSAILYAVRSAVPGFRSPATFSAEEYWIETGLRVFGSLFLALFVLAARSMVMRKPRE